MTLFKVEKLSVSPQKANSSTERMNILDEVSFEIAKGESYALVGESGSGKSMTCLSILGLLPANLKRTSGKIILEGKDISDKLVEKRGKNITYIPQNPMGSLNPTRKIKAQLCEIAKLSYLKASNDELEDICANSLKSVQLSNTKDVLNSYPFELSGGMCQRVLIAMALIPETSLVIADEPTTALDVTTQAEIMSLILDLTKTRGLSLLLITHDLALVSESCDRLSIMKDGKIVESGFTQTVFSSPQTEYSRLLTGCYREILKA